MRYHWWIIILGMSLAIAPTKAQNNLKSLILPMAEPPGPSTWLLGQAYGNTVGAFNFGAQWYSAGQGLHFGLDFPMPCGTQLVAAGDGVVAFVDNLSFGSGPHNLLIRHDALGVITLYGHLLERPPLVEGQWVTAGQPIALSGDPDITCDSRPHLHLEVRALNYRTAYNPVAYINAHWHSLALIGGYSYPLFQQDLQHSRRWLTIDEQPDVAFGGARLNQYTFAWPLPNALRMPDNPPLFRPFTPLPQNGQWDLRRIGYDSCCWRKWWSPIDPDQLYVIDGQDGQLAAIFTWSAALGGPINLLGSAPPVLTSPDGTHEIYAANGIITLRRSADNQTWTVNTNGAVPAINPDNTRLLWINRSGASTPGQSAPPTRIYISDIFGNNPQEIHNQPGASAVWLDAERILISQRQALTTTLSIIDVSSGGAFTLGAWDSIRGVSVAPGGGRLGFYQTAQSDRSLNGVYFIETTLGATAQKADWFGPWRWRDAESLYYIPYNPDSDLHQLAYYHVPSGEARILTTTDTLPFTIMNGDWEVSADGRRIVFHNAADKNMWLLELN